MTIFHNGTSPYDNEAMTIPLICTTFSTIASLCLLGTSAGYMTLYQSELSNLKGSETVGLLFPHAAQVQLDQYKLVSVVHMFSRDASTGCSSNDVCNRNHLQTQCDTEVTNAD